MGTDLAGPDLGNVTVCRIPGCTEQTVPYWKTRSLYCMHHLRIYAALQVLRAEGYHCANCRAPMPDVEIVSDLADALVGIPQ